LQNETLEENLAPQTYGKHRGRGFYFQSASPNERTRPPSSSRRNLRHNQTRQVCGDASAAGGREASTWAAPFFALKDSTPHRGYLVFFRYAADAVEIVNVLHASRDVEQLFGWVGVDWAAAVTLTINNPPQSDFIAIE
jgi:hypothetical protein